MKVICCRFYKRNTLCATDRLGFSGNGRGRRSFDNTLDAFCLTQADSSRLLVLCICHKIGELTLYWVRLIKGNFPDTVRIADEQMSGAYPAYISALSDDLKTDILPPGDIWIVRNPAPVERRRKAVYIPQD